MSALFNRAIKRNYSWLPVGKTSSIINSLTWGSCWIISAVLTNGEFLSIILEDTGKETNFWDFLCILKYAVHYIYMKEESDYIIMWDNASIHCSKLSLKTAKNLNLSIAFLPPYSPFLAPVELFFKILKSKMRKLMLRKEVNFNKIEGRKEIFNSVVDFDKGWIKKIWIEFVSNAKQTILRQC